MLYVGKLYGPALNQEVPPWDWNTAAVVVISVGASRAQMHFDQLEGLTSILREVLEELVEENMSRPLLDNDLICRTWHRLMK